MKRYFLTRVKIDGFRGINNERYPLEMKFKPDSVNSVFAVNASGKSSLFEALCYAIRGYVPKLKALQVGERPDDYVNNLFHSKKTATIELELLDESSQKITITVVRSSNGARNVSTSPPTIDGGAVLSQLNEDFTLVDYAQFTNFINSTPIDRGRSFSSLMGLSGYSQLRRLLQALSDTRGINGDFDLRALQATITESDHAATTSFSQLSTAYSELTGAAPDGTERFTEWGDTILESLNAIPILKLCIDSKRLSEVDFARLREVVRAEEGGSKKGELGALVALSTRLSAVKLISKREAGTQASEINAAIEKRNQLFLTTAGPEFQHLHNAGLKLYESEDWPDQDRCALCETQFTTSLKPHIQSQVAKYELVNRQEELIRKIVTDSGWLNCMRGLESVRGLITNGSPLADSCSTNDIETAALGGSLTEELTNRALTTFAWLQDGYSCKISEVAEQRSTLESSLPPSLVEVTTQIETAAQARAALSTYWRSITTSAKSKKRLDGYKRWQAFITTVTEDICSAEKTLTSARLTSLGDDYKELFSNIMGTAEVIPHLSRTGQSENLDVQLENFHGRSDLSARALLSESYRNALAVSVFLSAARRQSTPARFIVLDDITSSFDAGHQWRLMDEIRNRLQFRDGSDGLQFILLSHDGLLQKYFDKISQSGGWNHQRLQGMPPKGSVKVSGQNANRLREAATEFLDEGDTERAEPLLRQYLEFSLWQIISKLRIPVPVDVAIRDDRQMVGNCLDAILAAVKLHQKAGQLVLTSSQLQDLEMRHVAALSVNWVSHYATGSTSSLSCAVLQGVIQSIDALTECFCWNDPSSGMIKSQFYKSLNAK